MLQGRKVSDIRVFILNNCVFCAAAGINDQGTRCKDKTDYGDNPLRVFSPHCSLLGPCGFATVGYKQYQSRRESLAGNE